MYLLVHFMNDRVAILLIVSLVKLGLSRQRNFEQYEGLNFAFAESYTVPSLVESQFMSE